MGDFTMDIRAEAAYATISQRAASSYLKSLAPFIEVPVNGNEMAQSQRELHAFFSSLFNEIFTHPERFGLPLGEDLSIGEHEPDQKEKKQQVKRLLDKPKAMIAAGLDFLMQAGLKGDLDGDVLVLSGYGRVEKQCKAGSKFLKGFESVGLLIAVSNDTAQLQNVKFPHMLPALRALASACATFDAGRLGKFQFARCDFRALQGYQPQALDIYRVLDEDERAMILALHEYFYARDYKVLTEAVGPAAWSVKYQGDRKIKATPLFQVDYDDRYARPLRLQIKCVSTQRIAELLPRQSQALQDDFMRRANVCRKDECNWCRNQKTLGPSDVFYKGEWWTLCWYSTPDIHELNAETVEIIEQYEQMHAKLSPET
jgi:hypothetical protein